MAKQIQAEKAKMEIDVTVEKAMADAKKSGKFVLFVGFITDKKNPDGNSLLDWRYVRRNFPAEDLSKSHRAFKNHILHDLDLK